MKHESKKRSVLRIACCHRCRGGLRAAAAASSSNPAAAAAAGCCGSGIAASGGVGRALAEHIVLGESSLDLEAFKPDRFGQIDAFDEAWLERCSATRAAKSVG